MKPHKARDHGTQARTPTPKESPAYATGRKALPRNFKLRKAQKEP
jgi:hypothetical protein